MKLHLGLEWRILHILSSEDIDDFTDIKFLKLYLNLLVSDQNIFGSSSKIFGNLWKFFGKCLELFVWHSEQFWKIFSNLQKVVGNLRQYPESR